MANYPTNEQLVGDRSWLRRLHTQHPDWSHRHLALEVGRSLSWVKNWLKRFSRVSPDDEAVLWGLSRSTKTPPPPPHPLLLERLLHLRNHPPFNLKRIPGPRTLLAALKQDPELLAAGITPPNSTSTVYKLLVKLGCYDRPGLKKPKPAERPAPLERIAVDFKDASSLEIDPDGKKQHMAEVFNMVCEGTSVLWAAVARPDYNAETVVETLLEVFEAQGRPRQLRFDRDPRFVGSASGRDFPAAMVRLLHVLGIEPLICPAHQPWKNGFVERYNRNFKYECLLVHLPGNLGELREVTTAYQYHYNFERPHQGKACHDLPPRVAFPELPRLPGLPEMVDPDSWLTSVNGEHFIRKVRSDGGVALDKYDYYLGRELAGQYVALVIDAAKGQIVVEHHQQEVKRLNLKGLYGTRLSMQAYSEAIKLEARSERRGWRPKANEAASGGAAASTSDLVSITQMEQMPLPMAEESGVSKA